MVELTQRTCMFHATKSAGSHPTPGALRNACSRSSRVALIAEGYKCVGGTSVNFDVGLKPAEQYLRRG